MPQRGSLLGRTATLLYLVRPLQDNFHEKNFL